MPVIECDIFRSTGFVLMAFVVIAVIINTVGGEMSENNAIECIA